MIQYWITLIYSLSLFTTICSGIRYTISDEILLSMTKIPTDDVLESLHKLRIRESAQLKTVLELLDTEMHQKVSMPKLSKIEDNGEEKETQITKL